MKKIVLMILCGLFFLTSQATQTTVSNHPDKPAQYSDLQTALDDAAEGDTLIVYASPVTYGAIIVKKKVFIIGEGHFKCGTSDATFITTITLQDGTFPTTEPDSSVFISLKISNISNSNSSKGIRIERCWFVSVISGTVMEGWILINNIFNWSFTLGNGPSNTFANNLFSNQGSSVSHLISSDDNTNLFVNNLFLGFINASDNNVSFQTFTNGTFSNNIFYGLTLESCSNCVFNNNLTFNTLNGNIPAATNLLDTDPGFVNVLGTNGASALVCSDFNLDVGSAAIGAGTNGEDLGIFGGTNALEDILIGLPPSPFITSFLLNNPLLENTTKLKFNVNAEKGKN